MVLNLLVVCLFVDNGIVAINQVLFKFMGKDTFEWIHLVGIGNLLNGLGHLVVEESWFHLSKSSLNTLVGGKNDIGMSANNWGSFVGLDDSGMSHQGNVAVDVNTQIDFDEITFLNDNTIISQGGIVSTDLIDAEACWEGYALVYGFFVVDFAAFRLDEAICELTCFHHLDTNP